MVPLHIKRSLGIHRGKNNKLDATKIAQFAKKNIQELKPWQPPSECIQQLNLVFSIRKRLSKIKSMLIHGEKARSTYQTISETYAMNSFYVSTLSAVRKDIQNLEEEMLAIVDRDERLSRLLNLLKMIPFVGTIVGVQLIICTNEFIDFDSPKKFASYCGVAPFDYSSVTSVKGKSGFLILQIRRLSQCYILPRYVIRVRLNIFFPSTISARLRKVKIR